MASAGWQFTLPQQKVGWSLARTETATLSRASPVERNGPIQHDKPADNPPNFCEDRLSELHRDQLDAVRRDPRLDTEAAAFFDFNHEFREADRFRLLALIAMDTLLKDQALSGSANAAQTEWVRKEMILADRSNGYPHLNAMTLVSMFGSVDCLVERLAPCFREAMMSVREKVTQQARSLAQRAIEQTLAQPPEALADDLPTPDLLAHMADALTAAIDQRVSEEVRHVVGKAWRGVDAAEPKRVTGTAPERWETHLETAGLGPEPNEQIPATLADALSEVAGLRNVIVHRGGRIDEKALKDHPSLSERWGFQEEQFVRIDTAMYRRYSAALRTYAGEVERRVFSRTLPTMPPPRPLPMLDWEKNYHAGG